MFKNTFFHLFFIWVFICNFIFSFCFSNIFLFSFIFQFFSFFVSPNFIFFSFENFKHHFFSFQTSFFFILNFIFFHFPCPWHLKSRKTMKNNEKQWKTIKNKGKWKKKWSCKWKKMKIWTQSCRFSLRTRKSSKTRGNFHLFIILLSFFNHFLSFFFHFPCPWHLKSRKAMKNNEKQWKTIKNKGKWKKNEVANEKNENLDSKLQILIPNQEIFKNSRTFSFFHQVFLFFFIFLARGTWNTGKPWKTMKNNGKQSKTKENEKKWSCKWKKMKFWAQSCRFSLRTRKSSKTRGFHFFLSFFYHCFIIFFSFSLPVAPEIQESHEKQWKTMENHQKQRKMKTNEVANEKKWNFGLKVADSHSEPGNLKKLEDFFIFFNHFFYHCFIIFFSFSLPVAPEIQESHEKQWKTMENHQKQRKMKKNEVANEKKWKFGLKVADSHSEPGNLQKRAEIFIFLSFFFHCPCPWHLKSRKAMKINEKQSKTIKNKGKRKKMKLQMEKMKLQIKKMKFDGKRWWTKMKKWR